MAVKIIADSACDLPKSLCESLDIKIVSLKVYIDEEEHADSETEVISERLYGHMRNGGDVKTTQVPYETFHQLFESCAQTDDQYIYIGFSSELSGTFQTGHLVAEDIRETYPDFDITCIDSLGASIGYGLTVHKAGRMAQEGHTKEAIIKMVQFYIEHVEHIFTVDALEYLHRGGRVSKASAIVGDLLNIKPILDVEAGKLIPIEKIRGRKKALNRVVALVGERGDRLDQQVVAINHAADLDVALSIKRKLEEAYGIKEFIIREVGAVIGSHSGPGTVSVFFLNQLDDQVL